LEVPDFPTQIYAGRSGRSMPQPLCSDAFSKVNMLDPKLIVLAAVVIVIIAARTLPVSLNRRADHCEQPADVLKHLL